MTSIILSRCNYDVADEHLRVTPRHRREALENLARVLGVIPKKAFNLDVEVLVRGSSARLKQIAKDFGHVKLGTCGATGCAYGWAGADPWFRKRGLSSVVTFRKVGGGGGYVKEVVRFRSPTKRRSLSPAEWFGLTYDESQDLFGLDSIGFGDRHRTLAATRKKVRLLIAKYSAPKRGK